MDQPQAGNQGTQAPHPAAQNNMLMGILAYLGILIIIPYLVAKNEPFVKFHIQQGLVLVVIELGLWVLGMFMWQLYPIIAIINLGALVLSIIGIVNVIQNKQEELPLVGSFAKSFNI
jgi:uncharacterized membrane protein